MAAENGPPTEMVQMLQGLGVKKSEQMAQALKENGIETRSDLAALDADMLKELDTALKDAGVTIGDRAKLKRARIEVNEVKKPIGNGTVSVAQLVPGQGMQMASKLQRLFLGMSWSSKSGQNLDLDASCVSFASGAVADIIFFKKLRDDTQSMVHTGDVIKAADPAAKQDFEDMERIYIWLEKLPKTVDCLVFVANIFSQDVNFSDVESASLRLVNADTNQELLRVPLSGSGLKGNCLVLAKVYRVENTETWQLLALGMPTTVAGMSSVEGMLPMLQNTGCGNPPAPSSEETKITKAKSQKSTKTDAKAKAKGKARPSEKPSKKADEKPGAEKPTGQKPRSMMPCVALAVAGTAGIAAATAIYMNPELTSDMMNSEIFTSCADFSADALEFSGEALMGVGDLVSKGAGEIYPWAGSVVDSVPDMAEDVVDGLGCAADYAGDGLQFAIDGAPAVGDVLLDAGGGAVGIAGDGINLAGGALENVDLGDAGDAAGAAGGAILDAGGDAGGAIMGAGEGAVNMMGDIEMPGGAPEWLDKVPDPMDAGNTAVGCCKQIMSLFGGAPDIVGDVVQVVTDGAGEVIDAVLDKE